MNGTARSPKFNMQAISRFFGELRRRKVIKVAAAYAIVSWLVIQIGSNTFEALHLPPWALTLVIVLTALGFPIALVIAWSVELTPSGIRAEQPPLAVGPAEPPRGLPDSTRPSRSTLVSQRAPRRSRVGALELESEEAPAESLPASRVIATQLRHDLRTPMNAILGYSELLVVEAGDIGVSPFLPELKRLHEESKRMLEYINDAVPASVPGTDTEVGDIRASARAKLLTPSEALLAQAQALLEKAGGVEAAHSDLDRLHAAVARLVVLVNGLARPGEPRREDRLAQEVEQTLGRLRPSISGRAVGSGTLLVVDDNAMNRDLLTRQLVREGYNVLAVATGREALETLRLHEFDLVLLDIVMPEMDGVQVLDHIQHDNTLAEIPVIMMSALDEIGGVARCLEKGAADYMTKPFDPVMLRARVRSTLTIRHLREDLRHAEQRLEESATAMQQLARSVVPESFAPNFERGEIPLPMQFPEVTAVVLRFEGVDAMASRLPAETARFLTQALEALQQCSLDNGITLTRITDRSFTAIAGGPIWNERHAEAAADLALKLRAAFEKRAPDEPELLQVRIGMHTGLLTAGMAGDKRLVFGLWGDAVTTADAIAACAPLGQVRVSNATSTRLNDRFVVDEPLIVELPSRERLSTRRLGDRVQLPAQAEP